MPTFLSFKTPIRTNTQWYNNLCRLFSNHNIQAKWQREKTHHITVAFILNDLNNSKLCSNFNHTLKIEAPLQLYIDQLDAFTSQNGSEHIVYLSSKHPSSRFTSIVTKLRELFQQEGGEISADFKLHNTIARIPVGAISIEELRKLLTTIQFPSFQLEIKTTEYQTFRPRRVIGKWHFRP